MSTGSLPILYAEDDENDVFLMQRAFKLAPIPNPLLVMEDGREAIAYMSAQGAYGDRQRHPLPCLVLLDLKMPGHSGFDVLKWLRNQPGTATMPVIVLTSSSQDSDVHRAYLLGANAYLIKPGKPEELLAVVRSIRDFWLMHNRTPPRDGQLHEAFRPIEPPSSPQAG
jgi:CheY-like chemotaxis protein